MAELLVVEDDETIGRNVRAALTDARHSVVWTKDGASALREADAGRVDLVILDLGLPDSDGVDVCRALRTRLPAAVIVILTARDQEIDVVVGLEAGADDFLTKPVGQAELLARVRAHLRRAPAASQQPAGRHSIGALVVDEAQRRAWLGAHEIRLRAREFDLLARLARESGQAVSRTVLMADVWDEHWYSSTKTLDVHMACVRRALESAARESSHTAPVIATLRGFGYRLDPA